VDRISLCLIVRDEERFLPDCLASVSGAVDEIVVVDTGSRDRTREIATAAGARVLDFAWVDDFAAARNAALDAALGTHVLVLDADERLAGDRRALRRAAADPRLAIGLLPIHDAAALDASFDDVITGRSRLWEPCFVPRFFRRDPRVRFSRRVHETLFGDPTRTAEMLRERRAVIAPVDAPIVHYGEVPTLRAERSKRARNTKLLEMALAEDPSDGDLAGFLAMELFRAGETKAARAIGERHLAPFLAALAEVPADVPKASPVQLASVLGTCLLQEGEPGRALEVVSAAAAQCVEPHPNLEFLRGAALERLERFDEAARAFESCVAMHGRRFTIPVNPGSTSSAPRLRLANLRLCARDAGGALQHLDAHGPFRGAFEVPAALTRAEALLQRGRAAEALTALTPLFARTATPPDLFALAALAADRLGTPEPTFRAAATAPTARPWVEPRRRALLESS